MVARLCKYAKKKPSIELYILNCTAILNVLNSWTVWYVSFILIHLSVKYILMLKNLETIQKSVKKKKEEIIIISQTSNNHCQQHWSIFSLSILCMDFFHLVLAMTLYIILFSKAFLMPLKTLVNCDHSVAKSCLSWDPMDCSLPSYSVHGICQPRIMEWVAISFSKYKSYIQFHRYTTIYLIIKYPCY